MEQFHLMHFLVGDGTIPSDALFSNGDLISVQYDSCPDPDDLHASVAGRMVLDFYGLVRNEDYIVVNGTCGFDRPRSVQMVGRWILQLKSFDV